MHIRPIREDDADAFAAMFRALILDTPFMLLTARDRLPSGAIMEGTIRSTLSTDNSMIFVADPGNGRLAGFLRLIGGNISRDRHRGYLIVGVLPEYRMQGVGKHLLQEAEAWAREQNMTRIELTVIAHNRPAQQLYLSLGYRCEGIKRHSLKLDDGSYWDEYHFGKLLDEPAKPQPAIPPLPANACLLLIDMQQAIDQPCWGARNNPDAEQQVARLLAAWRERGMPVVHVRHMSTEPDSPYRPSQPGNDFKPESLPLPGERVIEKQTNSAFVGTALEAELRAAGSGTLVVAGVTTNNSVEATVRMAGNLGFNTWLAQDACFTFGRTDWNGRYWPADEVHALALANLDGEYASVTAAAQVLAALP